MHICKYNNFYFHEHVPFFLKRVQMKLLLDLTELVLKKQVPQAIFPYAQVYLDNVLCHLAKSPPIQICQIY